MATLVGNHYRLSGMASNAFSAHLGANILSGNVIYWGGYQIHGTVTEMGVAGSYRVRLFLRRTGILLRETWSAEDGTYRFSGLPALDQGYFAVAFDNSANPLNAAIADLITPEPMP